MWDTLKKLYDGDEKLKKFKLQSWKEHYENMQMNNGEAIAEFFSRFEALTNQVNSCGEKICTLQKMGKILRVLSVKFDHIVGIIKESILMEAWRI